MVRRRGSDGGQGRRLAFWSGVALVVAGVLVLGYVGWQVWGTTWVAKREQREITGSLEQQWTEGGARLQPEYVPRGEASALVRIPAFGQEYVVPVLEGTSATILTKGYGHFTKSADPGEVGNYALAAHRVTHGEPLRRMPELRPGDEVVVETVDTTYTYRLDTDPRELVIPFTGTWVLGAVPKNPDGGTQPAQRQGQRLITLTTCSEIFHTDDRMIAFGHLVKAEPKDR
ncbi:MAG: class E sortase [Marmoricola sp.]